MEPAKRVRRDLGNRLKELRSRQRLSQQEVALAAKISTSHLSAVERGVYSPTTDMLARIASALGVTIGDIVAGKELEACREVQQLLDGVRPSMRLAVLQQVRGLIQLVKEAEQDARRRHR